jgi:hypothetical protein
MKKTLKNLQMTQTDLSSKLGISQAKISLWLNKRAVAEPDTILTQMKSFLEAKGKNIQTRISAGSNTKCLIDSNKGTMTPPPPAMTTTLNAPPADKQHKFEQ